MNRFLNIDCFVPRNDGVWIASGLRPRNDELSLRHSDRSMRSASEACGVEESLHYEKAVQISPLHTLRWRSVCYGRNDGGCRSSLCHLSSLRGGTTKQSGKNIQLSIVNCQLSIRKSRHALIAVFLLFGFFVGCMAQEIRLDGKDARNRETVSVRLYDNNEGNYLLELPLTFHITPNNILFMIVGDDNGINGNNMIWMFDQTVSLSDFQKKNKHIGAAKSFKKQITRLESFFDQSENVEKYTWFDNGFEQVQASPKPVFFKVGDTSKPVVLKLRFYTSFVKNNSPAELSSEAGTVKITINL